MEHKASINEPGRYQVKKEENDENVMEKEKQADMKNNNKSSFIFQK